MEIIRLSNVKNKPIKDFSSGMKQRIKLGLAILAETEILLLDEPSSNLDKEAIRWYQETIDKYKENRIVFVASNKIEEESFFCNKSINIIDFKS